MTRIAAVEVVAVRVSPPPERAALRALRGEWVFVVARGEGGAAGVGEATHGGDDVAVAGWLRERLAPAVTGRDVSLEGGAAAPDALVRPWFARVDTTDRVLATAISGLEQALWDLAARAAGVPLWRALGGAPPAGRAAAGVPLYATLNRGIFDRSPDGFAAAARRARGEGFRSVKCAPFDGVAHGAAQERAQREAAVSLAVERVAAVRQAIGEDVDLMVDCHGRLTTGEVAGVARRLEPYRLRWLEEPVPFEPDPAPLALARGACGIPIAAGELMFGVDRFRPLLAAGAVDVIMPDVKHCGGLAEARRIAALAAAHGVAVAPHNPSGPVSTLASAHLCAALANAPLLEFAWGEVDWRPALLTPAEQIAGGVLALPSGPGLGADLDPETVAAHAYAASEP